MSYLESILLGVVQGLGEFLPISSSAHLVVTPWLFDFQDPGLAFDVALHFGTLFAILAYFWRDWVTMIVGSLRALTSGRLASVRTPQDEGDRQQLKILLFLVVATIPGALAGLLLEDLAETVFRNPLLVAMNMSVLGGFLLVADKGRSQGKDLLHLTLKESLLIGCSQALALFPGVSRSGITMTTGLFLGLSRVTAARFSFLLAAPITLGACILKARHFLTSAITGQEFVGILVSALVGFLSIKYLLKYVQVKDYRPFVYYRFVFTLVVLGLYFFR